MSSRRSDETTEARLRHLRTLSTGQLEEAAHALCLVPLDKHIAQLARTVLKERREANA